MAGTGPVAAVDCGTNSTRLLITDGSGNTLARLMRVTRLGQGVDATHALDSGAVDRTVDVLRGFRKEMDHHGVTRTRLVATSAVRDADNGPDFLRQATDVIGAQAELLAGQEEGRLAYLGATSELPPCSGIYVVVDIGGGSTELVVEVDGRIEAVSMDMGCVRLTERHLLHDPPEPSEVAAAMDLIADELDLAVTTVTALAALPPKSQLIGLAGTVSTLMALELGVVRYDRTLIHHGVLTLGMVDRWCETLAHENANARAARPGMLDGRQDVIVGGALILRGVMSRFGFGECLVSESDILDGLAMSILNG